jgi:hypothetical protein
MEKYLYWFTYGELCVPCESMAERMVETTYSSNNVREIVDDNNNHYRSMIIDVIRIN